MIAVESDVMVGGKWRDVMVWVESGVMVWVESGVIVRVESDVV